MTMRFRLALSAAFALLGCVSCLAYASSVREEAARVRADAIERFGGEVAQLVVAERTLEAGDVVGEADVSVRDWVSDLAPVGAVTSLEDVLGRELSEPAAEGSPLTDLNFRDATALSAVPAGHVAVSVPVTDKLGVSRGLMRGTRLTAYAVSSDVPRLIAADVETLSEVSSSGTIGQTAQLTVALLPENVAEVLGASATGELRLVMPADDVEAEVPPQPEAPEEAAIEGEGEGEQL